MYIIPANSKKSQLIFNVFRPFDLYGVLLPGVLLTTIFLFIFSGDSIAEIVIKLTPIGISLFLVMPLPYYHNVLVYIQELITFFNSQRRYYWRGWCASYVGSDDRDATKEQGKR